MEQKKVSTTVNIFGSDYRLRGIEDVEFAQRVAREVDRRMREVAGRQQAASQSQVAVMLLLNLTAELLREREGRRQLESEFGERVRALSDGLEEQLTGGG